MRISAIHGVCAALLLLLLLSCAVTSSIAQVKLNGWDVGKKDGTCVAVYSYRDKDDDDAANVVVLGLLKAPDGTELFVMSISYDKWNNDEDETADLYFDKQLVLAEAKWKMHDKHTLVGTFSGSKTLISRLQDTRQIILKFDPKTRAVFDIKNPSQALGALQQCVAS
jgi:hypothetical protein